MSPEEIRWHIERWSEIWGTPGLAREVRVRPSRRMYRSLGNYSPSRDEIRIAAHLLGTGGREMFLEVLGHETAHAAVRRLYPRGVRPHGSEWKALMCAAGFPPRASLPVPRAVAEVVAERRSRRRDAQRSAASVRGGIVSPTATPRGRHDRDGRPRTANPGSPPGERTGVPGVTHPPRGRGRGAPSRTGGAPRGRGDSIRRLAPGERVEDSIRPLPPQDAPIQGELSFWKPSAGESVRRRVEEELAEVLRAIRRSGIRP